jgi:hypothetical protein
MTQQPQPVPVPGDEPPPHPAEPLQIDTPVIDVPDLEHRLRPHTRTVNKITKIEPTMDGGDRRDFLMGEEAVLEALEELEESMRAHTPPDPPRAAPARHQVRADSRESPGLRFFISHFFPQER